MRRWPVAIFLFAILSIPPVYPQLCAGVGFGSGVFVAPNPGSVYAVPSSASFTFGVRYELPLQLVAEGSLAVVPFVPVDESFGTSLLAIVEGGFGARWTITSFRDGRVSAGAVAGAGGYVRAIRGDRASGTSRRPTLHLTPHAVLELFNWEYSFSLRYRLLLDRAVVHSFEPAVSVFWTTPVGNPNP